MEGKSSLVASILEELVTKGTKLVPMDEPLGFGIMFSVQAALHRSADQRTRPLLFSPETGKIHSRFQHKNKN